MAALRRARANAIVVSGDSHSAWANELDDANGCVAVEFAGTSVTSPSEAEYFNRAGLDFGALLRARNPHIKWTDQTNHGFLVLTLEREAAKAEFVMVSTILSKTYEARVAATFTVTPGDTGVSAMVQS